MPAVSVEVQVNKLVLMGHSSLSPLVLAVQDVCIVGQAFIMLNVITQGSSILTYRMKKANRREVNRLQQAEITQAIIKLKTWCRS